MKLYHKILAALIITAIVFNIFIYATFFYTFQKTNEQNDNIYIASKRLFALSQIKDATLELRNSVNEYAITKNWTNHDFDTFNDLDASFAIYVSLHEKEELADPDHAAIILVFEKISGESKQIMGKTIVSDASLHEYQNNLADFEEVVTEHYKEYQKIIDSYYRESKSQYYAGLVIIICSSLLLMLISALMLKSFTERISKPLEQMIDISKKISKGEKNVRSNIKSDDELGELGFAFNIMIDKIYLKNEELEKKVRELEKFSELVVNRELKMIDLKKRIEELDKK